MIKRSSFLCTALLLSGLVGAMAQAVDEPLPTVTRTFALKNATIVVKPGQVIPNGTVVIKDGLIVAAGTNVVVPTNAKILPADSLYVYAGFIDGLSNVGLPKPERRPVDNQQRTRLRNPGNPPYELAGIQPDLKVRSLLNPKDPSVEELRKLGFTTAQTVPYGRMLPGDAAVVMLHGTTADEMIIKDHTGLAATLNPALGGYYPNTVIAVMSKLRELYRQAEQAKAHEKGYAANPTGMERPQDNRVLTAFYPVIDQQLPLIFQAPDAKTGFRVLELRQDLKFPLVLGNLRQGWHLVDPIQAARIPVTLSLDLPKLAEKRDAKKDSSATKDSEMVGLEQRRAEEMRAYESQAGLFASKGIVFGFSTLNAKTTDIREALRRMIKNGLKEDQALAALTTQPAEMLGLSKTLGTVEKGKMANLVVTKKPYFDEKAQVRYVFIDGTLYEYDLTAPRPNADPTAKVRAGGKWNMEINAPGQTARGLVELREQDGRLGGSWTSAQDNTTRPLERVELKGNQLTFTTSANVGGQDIPLAFDLTIQGNKFSGKVTAGSFGTFEVSGDREGDPK